MRQLGKPEIASDHPTTLTRARAMRSFKALAELCGSNPTEAQQLLADVCDVPAEDAYDHQAAAYFALGYAKACLDTDKSGRAKFMLDTFSDFDEIGHRPSDYLGLKSKRKYGKP